MRNFRPLLLAKLDLCSPEAHLLRLEVHRHLPDHPEISDHQHRHHQWILYLTGHGIQSWDQQNLEVSQGCWALLPAGTRHRFLRTALRPPLCLVIDFKSPRPIAPASGKLNATRLRALRERLHALAALRHPRDWIDQLESEALAFSLLAFGLRSTAVDPPSSVARPIAGRIERLLKQPDAVTWTPRELARKAGLQSDYLNRRLKQETGRSLQQWRASERLLRAKRSLSQGRPIAEAAAQAGFQDVNYFCRWFRLQTDETPGTYRHRTTVQ